KAGTPLLHNGPILTANDPIFPPDTGVIDKIVQMFLNVSPSRDDAFMNTSLGVSVADGVERHRQHRDAVGAAGQLVTAILQGYADYVVASPVLAPGLVFDAVEHEPGEFVQLLDRIHEFNGALEGARARTEVALADSHVVRHRAAAMAQA